MDYTAFKEENDHDIADFKSWIKSDNVVKVEPNKYKTQCTLYVPTFSLKELKEYFKKEYNN